MKTLAMTLLLLSLSACSADDTTGVPLSAELDCDSFCNTVQCGGDTCDRRMCGCFGPAWREELVSFVNTCGSKNTCNDVKACQAAPPTLHARAIDGQGRIKCYDWAVRCDQDGSTCRADAFDLWSEQTAEAFIDCYDAPCDQVQACRDGALPTECSVLLPPPIPTP